MNNENREKREKREKLKNLFKCILIALVWDANIVLMIVKAVKGF